MPDKVVLVRPDGSLLEASQEDAEKLSEYGYRQESQDQYEQRQKQAALSEYWSSPGQKLEAGLEGAASGITLGLSDKALDAWAPTDDWRNRAEYNPGARLAGDIVGSILPAAVGDVGGLANAIPGFGAGRVGAEVAETLAAGSKIGKVALRTATEGALYGTGAEISKSAISGDPLTAETALAGAGWGALFGGGLGSLFGAAGSAIESRAASRALEEEMASKASTIISDDAYAPFRAAVQDAQSSAARAIKHAEAAVADAVPDLEMPGAMRAHSSALESNSRDILEGVQSSPGIIKMEGVREARKAMLDSVKNVTDASSVGWNPEKYAAATEDYTAKAKALTEAAGLGQQPVHAPFSRLAQQKAESALEELRSLGKISSDLDKFPVTAQGFSALTPGRAEKTAAAIEKFVSTASPELAGVKASLSGAVDNLVQASGIKLDNSLSISAKLRAINEVAREASSSAGKAASKGIASGGLLTGTKKLFGGLMGGHVGSKIGGGWAGKGLGYAVGSKLVGGVLGLKGAILGKISDTASKWVAPAVKVGSVLASRAEPLKVKLDGTIDKATDDRKELMKRRAKEILDAGPTIKDTLYRSIEPLTTEHPEFAASLHSAAVNQFNALATRLPRDPGNAFSGMKSLWEPNPVAVERFARAYEVFHNPVAAVMSAMNKGAITPEAASAIRDMTPELFQHMRVEWLNRLAEPGVMESLSYQQQSALGQALDIQIHSAASPQFIVAQQAMFQERNQPLKPNAPLGANNGGGGRPPGPGPTTSPAQRITEH